MNPREVADKSRAIYNAKLKRKLERDATGRFVIINMDPKKIAEKGRAIYNAKLKRKLEREAMGKFVVIDIDTKEYYIADRSELAVDMAKKARPKGTFYLHRIGYASAYALESLL